MQVTLFSATIGNFTIAWNILVSRYDNKPYYDTFIIAFQFTVAHDKLLFTRFAIKPIKRYKL